MVTNPASFHVAAKSRTKHQASQSKKQQQMKEFLYTQFEIKEYVEHDLAKSSSTHNKTKPFLYLQNRYQSCKLFKNKHTLKHCKQFKQLPIPQQYKFIRNNNICVICLALHHTLKRCTPQYTCFTRKGIGKGSLLHISPTNSLNFTTNSYFNGIR